MSPKDYPMTLEEHVGMIVDLIESGRVEKAHVLAADLKGRVKGDDYDPPVWPPVGPENCPKAG